MISICIPVYNYYVYPLVRRLTTQIEQMNAQEEFEVVCIDDHSNGYHLNQNMGLVDIAHYLRLSENIGRARIRNLFLKHTHGEWLLFLDNDSQVPEHFLKNYRKYVDGPDDVIVGGRIYNKHDDDQEHRLRYLYGTEVESRPAEERNQRPYQSFMTNNFMIRRSVLEQIKFDPRLSKYGHEDTLFGYRLGEAHVPIKHIDNPVVNGYVETNAEFLNKTIEGVESLVKIYNFMWEDQRFCRSVRLLNFYGQVRRMKMVGLVYRVFRIFKTPMENHFASGTAISIKQFNFYKLGTFIMKIHYDDKGKKIRK